MRNTLLLFFNLHPDIIQTLLAFGSGAQSGKKAFLFPVSCVLGNETHMCIYPTENL